MQKCLVPLAPPNCEWDNPTATMGCGERHATPLAPQTRSNEQASRKRKCPKLGGTQAAKQLGTRPPYTRQGDEPQQATQQDTREPPSSTKPNNGSSTTPSLTFISYLRRPPPTPGTNLFPFTAHHPPLPTHYAFHPLPTKNQPTNDLTLNALPQNRNPPPKLQPYNFNTFRLNHYILTSPTAYLLQMTLNLQSHPSTPTHTLASPAALSSCQQTANNQQPTASSQQPATNSKQPAAATVSNQQPATNNQ